MFRGLLLQKNILAEAKRWWISKSVAEHKISCLVFCNSKTDYFLYKQQRSMVSLNLRNKKNGFYGKSKQEKPHKILGAATIFTTGAQNNLVKGSISIASSLQKSSFSLKAAETDSLGADAAKYIPRYKLFKPKHTFLTKSKNNPDEPIVFFPDLFLNPNDFDVEANDMANTLETSVYVFDMQDFHQSITRTNDCKNIFYETKMISNLVSFCKNIVTQNDKVGSNPDLNISRQINNNNDYENKSTDKEKNLGVSIIGEGHGGRLALLVALCFSNLGLKINKVVSIESLPCDLSPRAIDELKSWVGALQWVEKDLKLLKHDPLSFEKASKGIAKFLISGKVNKQAVHDNDSNLAKIMNNETISQSVAYLLKNLSNKNYLANLEFVKKSSDIYKKHYTPYLELKVPLDQIEAYLPNYAYWPWETVEFMKNGGDHAQRANLNTLPKGDVFHGDVLFIMGNDSEYMPESITKNKLIESNYNDSILSQTQNEKEREQLTNITVPWFPNSTVKVLQGNHFLVKNQSAHVTNAICQFLLKEHNPMYDKLRKF